MCWMPSIDVDEGKGKSTFSTIRQGLVCWQALGPFKGQPRIELHVVVCRMQGTRPTSNFEIRDALEGTPKTGGKY